MQPRSLLAFLVAAVVLGGCARYLPPRVNPPPNGALEVGVAYGEVVYCPVPIPLADDWWSFDEPRADWPPDISIPPFPFSIWASVGSPHAVPGIVMLTSADQAVFRADVDGSEFRLTRHDENPAPGDACL
jgi:hypothetical protein